MTLTAKQEAFAQDVASGMNQTEAYRRNYDVKTATEKSVNEMASALANRVKVASRIAELKAEIAKQCLWSREDSVRVLKSIAAGEAKHSDQVNAVRALNAMHGFDAPVKIEGNLITQITRKIVKGDDE